MMNRFELNIPYRSIAEEKLAQAEMTELAFPLDLADNAHERIYIASNAIISAKGRFVFLPGEGDRFAVAEAANYDGVFLNASDAEIDLQVLGSNSERHSGDFALLHNRWSGAFYHWLEELISVALLEASGFTGKYIIPSGMNYLKDSLDLLKVDQSRIWIPNEIDLDLERVWICPRFDLQHSMIERPKLLRYLRSKLLKAASEAVDFANLPDVERLFAVRGNLTSNSRNIINYEETFALFQSYGFEAIDLANYSFAEQVVIASRVKIFAGAHGAGFCHTLFGQERMDVIEIFSPLYVNYTFLAIYGALDHNYVPLASTCFDFYPHGRNPITPLDALQLSLKRICA